MLTPLPLPLAVSFDLVDNNKVLDVRPRDAPSPQRGRANDEGEQGQQWESKCRDCGESFANRSRNRRQAGKETEALFTKQTKVSVNGWIEGSAARWVFEEDTVQRKGLPIETEVSMMVRWKPREVRYKYAVTIKRNTSGKDRRYEGQATLLFP